MLTSRKLLAATKCAEDFDSVTSLYETIKKVNSEIVEMKLDLEVEDDLVENNKPSSGKDETKDEKEHNEEENSDTVVVDDDFKNIIDDLKGLTGTDVTVSEEVKGAEVVVSVKQTQKVVTTKKTTSRVVVSSFNKS